jgi:hypothetical protein
LVSSVEESPVKVVLIPGNVTWLALNLTVSCCIVVNVLCYDVGDIRAVHRATFTRSNCGSIRTSAVG